MTGHKDFEVIIIGGSYAGLSAAMSLGRSLRHVAVIDSGKPCNATTPHSHNFLTQDGKTPTEIAGIAWHQVEQYKTVVFYKDLAVGGARTSGGFEIVLQSGKKVAGKKLIFASGIKDQLPDIPGLSACWGISVVHCPYCHGYENRGKRTAILGSVDTAMHLAPLVGNLTDQLTVLINNEPGLSDEQMAKLERHNINVIRSEVLEIQHERGQIRNVILKAGGSVPFDALYVKPPFRQHTNIPELLGCEITEQGYIKIDTTQKTTMEGVFACGDNSSMMRSVANAVATGSFAGAVVNKELANEQF